MARTLARILELTLNGRPRVDAVPDNLLLLDYLREVVGLTGTKTGCDGGECGACTVLVDDQPRLSCLTLAAGVRGQRVDTVESLGEDGHLSAVQRGFHEKLGAQCGYCTPGFIMASAGLLRRNPRPERGRHPAGAGQQHLPLHRLRQNHRGGEIRRRAQRRRSGAVNEIVPLARCAPGAASPAARLDLVRRFTLLGPPHAADGRPRRVMNEIAPLARCAPSPACGGGLGWGRLGASEPACPLPVPPPQAGEGTLEPQARRGGVVS